MTVSSRASRLLRSPTLLLISCCAPAPPAGDATVPPPLPLPLTSAPATVPVAPPHDAGAPVTASADAAVTSAPPTCPADMVIVDGQYCQNLRVTCLERWHAPQNKLWVCERVKEPTVCGGKTRNMRYCIDRYEFPNLAGERPMVMQNFYQAQVHCALRGKRICTETEWTKACEGPDNKPFPYGYRRDPTKCRGDMPYKFPSVHKFVKNDPVEIERLWQGVVSGSQPDCVSDYGVHDMPGNADELAASERRWGGPKSDFTNVTTGGPWYKGVRNMCRPKIYSHDEKFHYYYLSWRCCSEADGKPNEYLTAKQKARKVSWKTVVYNARMAPVPFKGELSKAGPAPRSAPRSD